MRDYQKVLGFDEGGPVPLPNYRGRNDYRKRTADEDSDPNDADDKEEGYLVRAAKAVAGAIPQKDKYPKMLRGPAVAVGIRG